MKKGDLVLFKVGYDDDEYELLTDPYEKDGVKVVDLKDYEGEVNVDFLKKYEPALTERDCPWCYERFATKEICEKHRSGCSKENEIKISKEEAWGIINNPKNY